MDLLNPTFFELNKLLRSHKLDIFISRYMYLLNSYAQKNNKFYKENCLLYYGRKKPYSSLLSYERAKGKIIVTSDFISTSEIQKIAEHFSGRNYSKPQYKARLVFSVIFTIRNIYKENCLSNAIKITEESGFNYMNKNEIVFLSFSFFYVIDVKIDVNNYTSDIYLKTIGKKEILEEKIKLGKEIKYNEKEKIMEIEDK